MVMMRTNCDCMVACLAMLLDCKYGEAMEYFPPKAVKETGYMWEWMMPYFRAINIRIVWYGGELIKEVDWSKPSIVTVPSLVSPDLGDHCIFWDGKKVIDPASDLNKPTYTELPDKIFDVRQLKTIRVPRHLTRVRVDVEVQEDGVFVRRAKLTHLPAVLRPPGWRPVHIDFTAKLVAHKHTAANAVR